MTNRKTRREIKTLKVMIAEYCRNHHGPRAEICHDCEEMLSYALDQILRCPLGDKKTTCARCSIHCFTIEQRTKIREVMKYAGPRMLYKHPVLAICHLIDAKSWKKNI